MMFANIMMFVNIMMLTCAQHVHMLTCAHAHMLRPPAGAICALRVYVNVCTC